jgi:hypothetical protein
MSLAGNDGARFSAERVAIVRSEASPRSMVCVPERNESSERARVPESSRRIGSE